MISKENFAKIDCEVKIAVGEIFSHIKKVCSSDKFLLFLANGEFDEGIANSETGYNPNIIDHFLDEYRDQTRINFLISFIKSHYSFPSGVLAVEDDEYRLNLELMIYSHIWESKSFLKQLYRLTQLAHDKTYPWKVIVPEMSKHKFIRNEIRNSLKKTSLDIPNIISKGFHTSLRNAFAHSDYSINNDSLNINLHSNGKLEDWELSQISFDDWTKRFVYSFLLFFYVLIEKQKHRELLISENSDKEFGIPLPTGKNSSRYVKIFYNSDHDIFRFIQK